MAPMAVIVNPGLDRSDSKLSTVHRWKLAEHEKECKAIPGYSCGAILGNNFSLFSYNNGMMMSSCREIDNNRSALSAASAFAIATAGANEGTPTKEKYRRMSLASTGFPTDQRNGDKEFVIRRAATNRVLNVLRHWVSKHSQDFETNTELKMNVICFLEEVMHDPELLTQERKAAANIIRTLTQEDPSDNQLTLEDVLQMAESGKAEPFENHSALEIAEQLTLLDHLFFKVIPYESVSNLIASEILRCEDMNTRVAVMEKWVAVADICRCLHNYNAVLEITSSLNRSAIFRLKKTWLKVSKQHLIEKLSLLCLNTYLCNWILDFLTGRPQSVRIGSSFSSTTTLSTGAPQGCVLSPLLFTLLTHDYAVMHISNHIVKFANDTTMVGLISKNDESAYREVHWCKANSLFLNVDKIKEMVVDFRRAQSDHSPLFIDGSSVEIIKITKFLGVHLAENFTWSLNTTSISKKAHQHLYFLRRLRKAHLPPPILTMFYRGIIENVLSSCITAWFGN
ncbi:hypothetical protein QTP70_009089 [Hemibagrus guttatus]|uniref:Ras-GEF domain-containing protein n=1 Tax=Hemibagrus guttatus TaxID=175788 RepID=A0AAE0R9H3_9TELE|nr:hypothetical protein QTP70_009089 [Hemibagrus guttatus]